MQTNRTAQRPSTLPGWVKFAAVGAVTLALSQVAPAGPHPIPAVAGVLIVVVALIWGRQWAAELERAEGKPPRSHR